MWRLSQPPHLSLRMILESSPHLLTMLTSSRVGCSPTRVLQNLESDSMCQLIVAVIRWSGSGWVYGTLCSTQLPALSLMSVSVESTMKVTSDVGRQVLVNSRLLFWFCFDIHSWGRIMIIIVCLYCDIFLYLIAFDIICGICSCDRRPHFLDCTGN